MSGAVALHLGALDESLVRPQELYLCIKLNEQSLPQLCAAWRALSNITQVTYRYLDPDIDSFSPLALEMLAEELPHLLQSLLVGVEHAINRVPLDELTLFHHKDNQTTVNDLAKYDSDSVTLSHKSSLILTPIGSPKCGLKRRELIGKNTKSLNKYALKRMSNKSGASDGEKNSSMSDRSACESPEPASNLPLFCLGRSFPHIDSDEESGDDMIKSDTGKVYLIFFFQTSITFYNM